MYISLMFRTYSDNYIHIPVREYRSVETNIKNPYLLETP